MCQLIHNPDLPKKGVKITPNTIARKIAVDKGEQFFFTGLPCKNGHIAKRFASNYNCFQCFKNTQKKLAPGYKLKDKYGITTEQYNKMLIAQNGFCAICKRKEITIDGKTKEIKKMSVDHCHETNQVRGLLCNNCNQGIGKFQHNSKLLKAAALYCEQSK